MEKSPLEVRISLISVQSHTITSRLVLHVLCLTNCDTPNLTTAATAVVMSARPLKRFSDFFFLFLDMKFKINKYAEFWKIWDSDFSNWKKVYLKFENPEFGFKITLLQRPFFVISDFAQNLLIYSSR